jgi:hypothetical protein
MIMPEALSGLDHRSFSIAQGESYAFDLYLEPPESVAGWTVDFRAIGGTVTFSFPPATVPPANWSYFPGPPYLVWSLPPLEAVPGIQPALPTRGSSEFVILDNASRGGVVVMDANIGWFRITIPGSSTTTVQPQEFTWWLRRVDLTSPRTLKRGMFSVTPGLASTG